MFLFRRSLFFRPRIIHVNNPSSLLKRIKSQIFSFSSNCSKKSDSSDDLEGIRNALQVDNERRKILDPESHLKSEKRLLIGFTCKKCGQRTHRTMSHHAYHHGIVLIECSNCQARHLIADNLGWFKDTPNAARRIEEMTGEVGEIRRSLNLSEDEGKGLIELLKD